MRAVSTPHEGGEYTAPNKTNGEAKMGILDIVGREVRTIRVIDLGDFNEVYAGARFEVNVTPTRGHVREWSEITDALQAAAKDAAAAKTELDVAAVMEEHQHRVAQWLAETWGMDRLEVEQIRAALLEKNPLAWEWLHKRTFEVIGEYRREVLKN
jgi:hypothetical protein